MCILFITAALNSRFYLNKANNFEFRQDALPYLYICGIKYMNVNITYLYKYKYGII